MIVICLTVIGYTHILSEFFFFVSCYVTLFEFGWNEKWVQIELEASSEGRIIACSECVCVCECDLFPNKICSILRIGQLAINGRKKKKIAESADRMEWSEEIV